MWRALSDMHMHGMAWKAWHSGHRVHVGHGIHWSLRELRIPRAATLLGDPPGWKPLCKDAADIGGAPMATPSNRSWSKDDPLSPAIATTALNNPQSHITCHMEEIWNGEELNASLH